MMNPDPSSSSPRRASPPFPHLTIAISHSYSIGWLMDDIMSYVPPPPLLRITLSVNQPYDYHFNHMVARSITAELLWPKPSISPFHMITSWSLPSISQALPPRLFCFCLSINWYSSAVYGFYLLEMSNRWVKSWPGESSCLPNDIPLFLFGCDQLIRGGGQQDSMSAGNEKAWWVLQPS